MYYNKRLHPRQPNEHYDGCILREFETTSRPSKHSSMSSLNTTRRRTTSTGSASSGSVANLPRRDYCKRPTSLSESSDFSLLLNANSAVDYDAFQSSRSPSRTSDSSFRNVSFLETHSYQSPENIIASLFPQSPPPPLRKPAVWHSGKNPDTFDRVKPILKVKKNRQTMYRPDSLSSLDSNFQCLKYVILLRFLV